MANIVTEASVRDALPVVRAAIDTVIENTIDREAAMQGKSNTEIKTVLYAAFQIALIEKAAELAKLTFATSRVDFALAARELYDDDQKVKTPDDS